MKHLLTASALMFRVLHRRYSSRAGCPPKPPARPKPRTWFRSIKPLPARPYFWSTLSSLTTKRRSKSGLVTDEKTSPRGVQAAAFRRRFASTTRPRTPRLPATFDESVEHPSELKVESGGLQWEVIGHRNHLGRGGVVRPHAAEGTIPVVGTTAVSSARSLGDGRPPANARSAQKAFAEPGKLYVWFLRGGSHPGRKN